MSAAATALPRGPYAPFADTVMSRIRGQQDAQRLLHVIRQGHAPEDALLDGIHAVHASGDAERERGFVRELQKLVERMR